MTFRKHAQDLRRKDRIFTSEVPCPLPPSSAAKLYTDMWRIRLFEEEALRQTSLGSVKGALHTYCGEEAVAVGVCAHLRDDDYVLGTHRSHGHCLAKARRWSA